MNSIEDIKLNKIRNDQSVARDEWLTGLCAIIDEYEKGNISLEQFEALVLRNRERFNKALTKLIRRLNNLEKHEVQDEDETIPMF